MSPGSVTDLPATAPRSSQRTRGRPPATTREEILARAVDHASAEGLEGVTIGRLAEVMEMSKSGLFRHFGSKEELQIATVDAAALRYAERVISPALELPPGAERLRLLLDRYLSHLEEETFSGGCFWAAASAEFDDRPGRVRDRIQGFVRAWLDLLEREALAAGAQDPEQLAFELHSVGLGANLRRRLLDEHDAAARARVAVARLIAGAL